MKKLIILFFVVISNIGFAQNEGIIEYYNNMISLSNYYSKDLDTDARNYKSTDQSLTSYKKYNRGVVSRLHARYASNEREVKLLEAAVLVPPSGLKNKESIVMEIKAAISAMNKNRDIGELLETYVADEIYKTDDELKQFYSYMDTFQSVANSVFSHCEKAVSLASDQTFEIELEYLKEAPFGAWIIPMKKDIRAADLIFKHLEKKDTNLLKSSIAKAKTTLADHKSTEGKPDDQLKMIYYKSVYEDFYKKFDEFLGRVSDDNPNLDYVSENYGEMIEKYNQFISQYNE